MRNSLSWRASEFQLNELAQQFLAWVALPRGRTTSVGALTRTMVLHDRFLTRLRLDVHRQ